jgi:hypothetical protein
MPAAYRHDQLLQEEGTTKRNLFNFPDDCDWRISCSLKKSLVYFVFCLTFYSFNKMKYQLRSVLWRSLWYILCIAWLFIHSTRWNINSVSKHEQRSATCCSFKGLRCIFCFALDFLFMQQEEE